MKKSFYLIIILCIATFNVQGESILLNYSGEGDIFYQLSIAVGLLDKYDKGEFSGLKIDFGQQGIYYSQYKGANWWEYFFKKIEVGDTSNNVRRIKRFELLGLGYSIFQMDIARIHYLVKKYINIQPEILKKVADFKAQYLNDSYVIGVSYIRYDEASAIPYKQIYDILLVHLLQKPNVKILVYTNDVRFYSFLKVKHPDNVVRYEEHVKKELKVDEAEADLVSCLLHSTADFLICTPSFYSLAVSVINPFLPVIQCGNLRALRTE